MVEPQSGSVEGPCAVHADGGKEAKNRGEIEVLKECRVQRVKGESTFRFDVEVVATPAFSPILLSSLSRPLLLSPNFPFPSIFTRLPFSAPLFVFVILYI